METVTYDFDNQSIGDININIAMSRYEMTRNSLFDVVYSLGRKLNEADISVVSLDANAKKDIQDIYTLLDNQTKSWKKTYYAQWIDEFASVIKDVHKILRIYDRYFNERDLQEAAQVYDISKRIVMINILSDNKFDRNAKLNLMICFRRLSHILNLDIVAIIFIRLIYSVMGF